MTLPCFLAKIVQILQIVILFFLERGKEIESWYWHIWMAQWLTFFPTTAHFFYFGYLHGKAGGQSCTKTLGPSLFHENSNPSKFFQTMFFFPRVLPLVKISVILHHIWGSKGPKFSQKEPFHGCWIVTRNFENF